MARPSGLTKEVRAKLIEAASVGASQEMMAGYAGITSRTLRYWIAHGKRKKKGSFFRLFLDLQKARQKSGVVTLAQIRQSSASGSVKAATWYMERVFPDDFGSQAKEIRELQRRLDELEKDKK